ncbi:MAG: hypothetical protein ACFCUS_07565 [Rubrimonas sp.]|uniref:hypothetical protein n=1 Tax=Rubrimonas sp. TaxID=2036015 RepID=UPI002FDCBA4B
MTLSVQHQSELISHDRPCLAIGMQVALALRAIEIVEDVASHATSETALDDAAAGLTMLERSAARRRARIDALRAQR